MNAISNFSRFNQIGTNPLTEEQLRSLVPSAFAASAHESRSARYVHIPSTRLLSALSDNGFVPYSARQSKPKTSDRYNYAKHMIRFRHIGGGRIARVGDVAPEVVLVNAHDGTSLYQLFAGLFRAVCLNGMVVSAGNIEEVRIPHKGNVIDQVIEGSFRVLESAKLSLEAPERWSGITLSPQQRLAFAEAAHALRFADADGNINTPIKSTQLLEARRQEDTSKDLWTTFNVVQENVLRGGLHGVGRDANNRPRRVTTRSINGIDQNVKLNRSLWELAEKTAKLAA